MNYLISLTQKNSTVINTNCTLSYLGKKWIKNILIQFLRYAEQVFVGDEILAERNGKVMNTKVIDVSRKILQGNKKY